MICPACDKEIGAFHRTPNGFHRDCYKHWQRGYDTCARFCKEETELAGLTDPFELYKQRMTKCGLYGTIKT